MQAAAESNQLMVTSNSSNSGGDDDGLQCARMVSVIGAEHRLQRDHCRVLSQAYGTLCELLSS